MRSRTAVRALVLVLSFVALGPTHARPVTPSAASDPTAPGPGRKAAAVPAARPAEAKTGDRRAEGPRKRDRRGALLSILERLGVGEGAIVADIGAGSGTDSMTLADAVGPMGIVYSEEIRKSHVERVGRRAREQGKTQIVPVLGRDDHPELPHGVVDLAYMHHVFHHMSKPREMVAALWWTLRPGGYMVIVDRAAGRGHDGIVASKVLETCCRAGFVLADRVDHLWYENEPYVLVFQRPRAAGTPDDTARDDAISVAESDEEVTIDNGALVAAVRRRGYVSGVAAGLLDKRTGARELGFGLHIMDFLLAPGWRDDGYLRDPKIHGNLPKHYVEGPQICTQAKELPVRVVRGGDFVAVQSSYTFKEGHNGFEPGSEWTQTIVFQAGARYFLSAEEIRCANTVEGLFYRIDMPGHLKHPIDVPGKVKDPTGDRFSEVYLSYLGAIPSSEFAEPFGPDERFLYRRGPGPGPERFIRAYRINVDGRPGPYLAGMTLDPAAPSEAWCHERGYVCFIQELHGRDVEKGETIGAAYVVGFFDSVEEMNVIYDRFRGKRRIVLTESGYELR